jgi:hypothetical protein
MNHLVAGMVRCVVWTVQSKSSQRLGSCDVYLITLALDESANSMKVLAEQLLKQSKLPPHNVRIWAPLHDFSSNCDVINLCEYFLSDR